MSININVSEHATSEMERIAAQYGITVEEFARRAVLERLEDEYDLQCANEALEEYEKDPTTYTHEEVGKHLGIK